VGVIEQADNATVLRIGADDLDWIARYLASLPCGFTVIEPEDLRESVARLATQLAASG
jgi:predicted DNA-binding transcriptional regulator YafY